MLSKAGMERNDIIRLIALGALAIIDGLVVVSVVLNLVFVPIVPIVTYYPNVASVAVLLLPVFIGMVARRLEVAIVLAVTPFFVLAVLYTTVYAPVWNQDLFQLGVLAGRVAGAGFLFGGLGAFGWMLRRIFNRAAQKGVAQAT